MNKTKVLFVCIHNSARSQMAEAFLNHHCGQRFAAYSAGIEPGKLNPIVVQAMRVRGMNIAGNATKNVFGLLGLGMLFEYVITVCDETNAERCPVFPGQAKRLRWGFPDPSAIQGSQEVKLAGTTVIRDSIEKKISEWCGVFCGDGSVR